MPTAVYPVYFPHPGFQVLSAMIHFLGLSIISHCLSRRIQHENLTYHGLVHMPWPRLSVILMFTQTWLFLLASGVLIFGVGLEYSKKVCTAAIYLCILLYCTAKFFVYAFLAEKVHIVWSPTVGIRRFESPVYLTCIVSVSLYCIVTTLMLGGPIHDTNSQGACIIGLKPLASIPLLVYDLYINLFLTFMFLFPLFRSKLLSPGVRRLAIRTLVGAIVALTTSTINIVVLIMMKGRELGWVNLGACGVDVIVNGTAIFWVSGGKGPSGHYSSGNGNSGDRVTRRKCDKQAPAAANPNGITVSQVSGNVDSVYFNKHSLHPTDPPSFPRYNFDSPEPEGTTGVTRRVISGRPWYVRLFGKYGERGGETEPQHLAISVTTVNEFETHNPIELQPRSDGDSGQSDLERQVFPQYPEKIIYKPQIESHNTPFDILEH